MTIENELTQLFAPDTSRETLKKLEDLCLRYNLTGEDIYLKYELYLYSELINEVKIQDNIEANLPLFKRYLTDSIKETKIYDINSLKEDEINMKPKLESLDMDVDVRIIYSFHPQLLHLENASFPKLEIAHFDQSRYQRISLMNQIECLLEKKRYILTNTKLREDCIYGTVVKDSESKSGWALYSDKLLHLDFKPSISSSIFTGQIVGVEGTRRNDLIEVDKVHQLELNINNNVPTGEFNMAILIPPYYDHNGQFSILNKMLIKSSHFKLILLVFIYI